MAKRKKKKGQARQISTQFGPGSAGLPGVTKPKRPSKPAYGTYDPALDQQERASQRGLGDLVQDVGTANRRSTTDLQLGTQQIERQSGRSLADLLTARKNSQQDYTNARAERTRQYGILGGQQAEKAASAGVLGGAIAQAAEKRAANQGREQQADRNNLERFLKDSSLAQTRLGEDKALQLGDLNLNFERGWQDRNEVQVPRAQREADFYSQDVNELRIDQAKQAGLLPGFNPYPATAVRKPKQTRTAKRGAGRYGAGKRRVF